MSGDNRDWYRDWWRKKTGYVERALFRVSEGEVERGRHLAGWRRNWLVLVVLACVVALWRLLR